MATAFVEGMVERTRRTWMRGRAERLRVADVADILVEE